MCFAVALVPVGLVDVRLGSRHSHDADFAQRRARDAEHARHRRLWSADAWLRRGGLGLVVLVLAAVLAVAGAALWLTAG
jgi:hypothetical protein